MRSTIGPGCRLCTIIAPSMDSCRECFSLFIVVELCSKVSSSSHLCVTLLQLLNRWSMCSKCKWHLLQIPVHTPHFLALPLVTNLWWMSLQMKMRTLGRAPSPQGFPFLSPLFTSSSCPHLLLSCVVSLSASSCGVAQVRLGKFHPLLRVFHSHCHPFQLWSCISCGISFWECSWRKFRKTSFPFALVLLLWLHVSVRSLQWWSSVIRLASCLIFLLARNLRRSTSLVFIRHVGVPSIEPHNLIDGQMTR